MCQTIIKQGKNTKHEIKKQDLEKQPSNTVLEIVNRQKQTTVQKPQRKLISTVAESRHNRKRSYILMGQRVPTHLVSSRVLLLLKYVESILNDI